MPKLKTHKGMKKRFKVSATGKVSHKRCGSSHLNSHKSGKRVRRLRKSTSAQGDRRGPPHPLRGARKAERQSRRHVHAEKMAAVARSAERPSRIGSAEKKSSDNVAWHSCRPSGNSGGRLPPVHSGIAKTRVD